MHLGGWNHERGRGVLGWVEPWEYRVGGDISVFRHRSVSA